MNKWLMRIFPWILLAPVVLPLFYFDGLLYSYVTLKTVLFRGIGIVALSVFVYLAMSGSSFYWGRLRSKLTWIPATLLFVAYATSALGVDFYHSFWSVFSRGDGLLTLSFAVTSFYLMLLYSSKIFFSKFLKSVFVVSTIVALYALLQWIQVTIGVNIPMIEEPNGRIGGTFGNAAFLSGYLSMTIFLTLAFLVDSSRAIRNFVSISLVLQTLVVFLTATRGSVLALFITGVIFLIYNSWRGNSTKIRKYSCGVLAGILILSSLFFVFRESLKTSTFEPVSRIASISFEDKTVSSRIFVWNEVFAEAIKSPLVGYGAENIDVLFDRVYDPDEISEQWFDRSHNTFLDYFVQYGIAGLLLYLSLISILGVFGFRMWKRGDIRGVYFMAMTIVYSIQNFFVFDTAMTLWLLFVSTAMVLVISNNDESGSAMRIIPYSRFVGAVLSILIILLIIPISFNPLRANLSLAEGYKYHVVDVLKANEAMDRGLSLNTYADLEYGYQLYVMYTERQSSLLEGKERVIAYDYAYKVLSENFKKYPYDARTVTYLAHVIDLAPPEVIIDEEFFVSILDKAIELSPKRIQPWFIKANISIREGDTFGLKEKRNAYEGAISLLEDFTQRVPKNSESRYIIATLYLAISDTKNASLWAKKGFDMYSGDIDTANRALSYYLNLEDWINAKSFLEDIIEENPENYELIYDLAKLYFLTGDIESSIELVEKIKKEQPGLFETDPEFVRAIESI